MAKRHHKRLSQIKSQGIAAPVANTTQDGGFSSGSRVDRAVSCWTPPLKSADAAILPNKNLTSSRALDLSRNNGYARGALQSKKDRVVGSYFKLQLRPKHELIPGLDREQAMQWASTVEKAFHIYADDPDCWIDARRQSTFTQLLRECAGVDMIHGEHFLSREYRPSPTGYGTCFLTIEPERICDPHDAWLWSRDGLRGGVYQDKYGAAYAYSVRTTHQYDVQFGQSVATWQKVPKYNKDGWLNIIHTFERNEPNQTRGISPFASIIAPLKMHDQLKATQLESAILSTVYTMYVKSELTEPIFEALSQVGDSDNNMLSTFMSALGEYHQLKNTKLRMDGVTVPHLAPGESLEMVGTNNQAGAFAPMEQTNMREISRGTGLSYEELTSDYTNTTYSSARMSQSMSWEHIKAQREGTIIKTATQIFRLWLDEAVALGRITMPAGIDYWTHRAALTWCDWIGAGRIIVDEVKHAAAIEKLISIGVMSVRDACAESGKDWEEMLEQQALERKKRAEYGLPESATSSTYQFIEQPQQ